VTLKTGVMMLNIQLCHHRNILIKKNIIKTVILKSNNYSKYDFLMHFSSINADLLSRRSSVKMKNIPKIKS